MELRQAKVIIQSKDVSDIFTNDQAYRYKVLTDGNAYMLFGHIGKALECTDKVRGGVCLLLLAFIYSSVCLFSPLLTHSSALSSCYLVLNLQLLLFLYFRMKAWKRLMFVDFPQVVIAIYLLATCEVVEDDNGVVQDDSCDKSVLFYLSLVMKVLMLGFFLFLTGIVAPVYCFVKDCIMRAHIRKLLRKYGQDPGMAGQYTFRQYVSFMIDRGTQS
jgi:hypothetical protein